MNSAMSAPPLHTHSLLPPPPPPPPPPQPLCICSCVDPVLPPFDTGPPSGFQQQVHGTHGCRGGVCMGLTKGMLTRAAARDVASSRSGCAMPCMASGATMTGKDMSMPVQMFKDYQDAFLLLSHGMWEGWLHIDRWRSPHSGLGAVCTLATLRRMRGTSLILVNTSWFSLTVLMVSLPPE